MITFIDENGVTKTPNDFSLDVLPNHEHEAIPETKDRTLSIPEKDGLLYYGSDLGAREFNIPMIVKPQDNKAMLQQRIRDFAGYMFNGYGRPKKIKMVFDYEPDKYYHVRFSGRVVPERLYRMAQFDLPLIADDPYAYAEMNAYDPTENYYYGSIPDDAYYENTESFNWIYSKHYSGVHNYSTLYTDLVVEIEGTVTNPSITLTNTGEKLALPSITNQKMEIDSSKYSIKVNGVSSIIGDFFKMVDGDNGFLFEGESPNATVTYKWKHKFI